MIRLTRTLTRGARFFPQNATRRRTPSRPSSAAVRAHLAPGQFLHQFVLDGLPAKCFELVSMDGAMGRRRTMLPVAALCSGLAIFWSFSAHNASTPGAVTHGVPGPRSGYLASPAVTLRLAQDPTEGPITATIS